MADSKHATGLAPLGSAPLPPALRAPPLAGLRAVGTAMLAPFVGIGTIASRPRVWHLACTPTLLLLGFWAAGAAAASRAYAALIAYMAGRVGGGWLGTAELWLAKALVVLLLGAAVLVLSALLVPPLAGPFMDSLAGKVDRRPQRDEPFWVGALRGARAALAGMAMLALPQLVLLALSVFVSALSFVWVPLGVFLSALGLAYDALDWPLARRGLGVRARLAWMGDHKAIVLGLGLGAWVFSLVPGLPIVLLPAIVAGGVRLVNRVEDDEERERALGALQPSSSGASSST